MPLFLIIYCRNTILNLFMCPTAYANGHLHCSNTCQTVFHNQNTLKRFLIFVPFFRFAYWHNFCSSQNGIQLKHSQRRKESFCCVLTCLDNGNHTDIDIFFQRTFDIANIQIEFVKSKSFFNFFFDKFSYQKPCQTFVAMGRVELPYGPYERPVLPLDYIAYTPNVLF